MTQVPLIWEVRLSVYTKHKNKCLPHGSTFNSLSSSSPSIEYHLKFLVINYHSLYSMLKIRTTAITMDESFLEISWHSGNFQEIYWKCLDWENFVLYKRIGSALSKDIFRKFLHLSLASLNHIAMVDYGSCRYCMYSILSMIYFM